MYYIIGSITAVLCAICMGLFLNVKDEKLQSKLFWLAIIFIYVTAILFGIGVWEEVFG